MECFILKYTHYEGAYILWCTRVVRTFFLLQKRIDAESPPLRTLPKRFLFDQNFSIVSPSILEIPVFALVFRAHHCWLSNQLPLRHIQILSFSQLHRHFLFIRLFLKETDERLYSSRFVKCNINVPKKLFWNTIKTQLSCNYLMSCYSKFSRSRYGKRKRLHF